MGGRNVAGLYRYVQVFASKLWLRHARASGRRAHLLVIIFLRKKNEIRPMECAEEIVMEKLKPAGAVSFARWAISLGPQGS